MEYRAMQYRGSMGIEAIRAALKHVDTDEDLTPPLAEDILHEGGWASGREFAADEARALRALAAYGDDIPEDMVRVVLGDESATPCGWRYASPEADMVLPPVAVERGWVYDGGVLYDGDGAAVAALVHSNVSGREQSAGQDVVVPSYQLYWIEVPSARHLADADFV